MIFKCILLALSASIDALSLGVTYGIKQTKMSKIGNIIIFSTLLFSTSIATLIGYYISVLCSPMFSIWLGSLLLIFLGIYTIYKSKDNVRTNFDTDNSNYIDEKESFILGLAVAVDASCVSLGSGMIGLGSLILPLLMAIFHTFFVNCGNFIATTIVKKLKISNKILSIFAGIILIFIAILRLI